MAILAVACAGAGMPSPATASCFEFRPDTSEIAGSGSWGAEELRLLARIRQAGRHDQVPDDVINALIEISSNDIDLKRAAQPGDGFRVYYKELDGGRIEVLLVSLTYGCETRAFYRFVGDDGVAGYYDDDGRSARKQLTRNPVEAGMLLGRFGYREPVWSSLPAFHHGVDWWAPPSASIYAAGDGLVEEVRREPDTQWLVRLRHGQAYESQYEVAALASGVEPG